MVTNTAGGKSRTQSDITELDRIARKRLNRGLHKEQTLKDCMPLETKVEVAKDKWKI